MRREMVVPGPGKSSGISPPCACNCRNPWLREATACMRGVRVVWQNQVRAAVSLLFTYEAWRESECTIERLMTER